MQHRPFPAAPASRRSDVEPFHAMDVMAAANRLRAEGHDVISLAVGQPSAPAPRRAREAATRLIAAGSIGYTDALGRPELRARLSEHYRRAYGQAVDPARIMITTGSSAGFNLAFLACFDPGARVAMAAPGYPAYRNILRVLGLEPVEIEVDAASGYRLTAAHLRAAHAANALDGVLVASPANPTGTATPAAELARIARFTDEAGLHLISDEIYHGLTYGAEDATALAVSPRAVVVNSFSKFYCMTGWRVGWLVLPEPLVRPAERIGQSLYISAPDVSQVAAMAALDAEVELRLVRDGYRRSRDRMAERLPRLGFGEIAPMDGAFYAYARIPDGALSATDYAARILAECHVAITPGTDFDLRRGHRFVRLSYAGAEDAITQALDRIAAWSGTA